MARMLLVLLAVFVVPSIVTAHLDTDPFVLGGSVYCDTCRCGYQTSASKPLAGAVVGIECRSRTKPDVVTYTNQCVTKSDGTYKILVHGDRGDDFCDAVLLKSSDPECSTPNAGRDRARVILTRNNGMDSSTRYANAMGFLKNTPLASCPEILKQYQEAEE